MKKNLSTLCFAGLVALTGLIATGCGDDTTYTGNYGPTSNIHEYLIVANNNAAGSFTIKSQNIQDGTSSVLNNNFTTGVGVNPTVVKTHPNINVFYILNTGSATVSQYTMDANGGANFLGTVSTPANPTLLSIHPSGGFVYVVGANAVDSVGTIRRFTVNADGTLANGFDVATTGQYTRDLSRVKDADYSFGGGTFHVPQRGGVVSYAVGADGTLGVAGTGVQAPTISGDDDVRDVDVRPGQAALVASVRTVAPGNDSLLTWAVNNGVLSGRTNNVSATESLLGHGDFASNGQYYVGSGSNPRMFGFNVDNSTGVLSALGTNPMAVTTGVRSAFVNLDPSNNFMLSTGGNGDNVLVARFRGANGEFVGSTADSQSLSNPNMFDYFTFNF